MLRRAKLALVATGKENDINLQTLPSSGLCKRWSERSLCRCRISYAAKNVLHSKVGEEGEGEETTTKTKEKRKNKKNHI